MNKKPEWIKKRITVSNNVEKTIDLLTSLSLYTVCENADCPNLCECYSKKTATFMIMGNQCTRQCRFCSVTKGSPACLDAEEPQKVAKACLSLGLRHVVVTSVTRDDLPDGGAQHFVDTVKEIRKLNPLITIELLIPDLQGDWDALNTICESSPDIINHNVETVPSLYKQIRPQAIYSRSLQLLDIVKTINASIYIKSGIILGLGEKKHEVLKVMDDLLKINCDILTISQYLQPTKDHIEVKEYIHPDIFDRLKSIAFSKGFKHVASGPFVRSSYNAESFMDEIKLDSNKNKPLRSMPCL